MSLVDQVKEKIKEQKSKSFKRELSEKFLLGAVYGLGQALGLTLIFALILTYLSQLFSFLGGVPYIGTKLADIVAATQKALEATR